MKTSKMIFMLNPVDSQATRYYVEGTHYNVDSSGIDCALWHEPIKGALVHFKHTDKDMSLFVDFTRDTISIDGIETNVTDTARSRKRMTEDYEKINGIFGGFQKCFSSPIINLETKLNLEYASSPCTLEELRIHVEQKVKSNSQNARTLFHNCILVNADLGDDIKDIALLTKSMFRMPRIFKYTAKD